MDSLRVAAVELQLLHEAYQSRRDEVVMLLLQLKTDARGGNPSGGGGGEEVVGADDLVGLVRDDGADVTREGGVAGERKKGGSFSDRFSARMKKGGGSKKGQRLQTHE